MFIFINLPARCYILRLMTSFLGKVKSPKIRTKRRERNRSQKPQSESTAVFTFHSCKPSLFFLFYFINCINFYTGTSVSCRLEKKQKKRRRW